MRSQSLLVDLAVGVYLLAAGLAALFALGWTMAPFENAEANTAFELSLISFAIWAVVIGG